MKIPRLFGLKTVLLVFIGYLFSDMLFDMMIPTPDRDNFDDFVPNDMTLTHKDLTTEDGYIVRLHILEHNSNFNSSLPPIYLQHGYAVSAGFWLINDEQSTAIYFARKGFRVYMLNGRGVPLSQTHTKLNSDSAEYWDFSFEDLAYDIKVVVDYIKAIENKKVVYIGHSQGALQILAALGDDRFKNDLQEKIYKVYTISPVICIKGDQSAISLGGKFYSWIETIKSIFGLSSLGNKRFNNNFIRQLEMKVFNSLCGLHPRLCFWAHMGTDLSNEFNSMEHYGTFKSMYPTVAPMKGTMHFIQLGLESKKENCLVRRFDYGKEKNIAKYGSEIPPAFNISSIALPIRAYFGTSDKFFNKDDIEDFAKLMKNVPQFSYQVKDNWGHLSFSLGKKSSEFYQDLIDDIKNTLITSPVN